MKHLKVSHLQYALIDYKKLLRSLRSRKKSKEVPSHMTAGICKYLGELHGSDVKQEFQFIVYVYNKFNSFWITDSLYKNTRSFSKWKSAAIKVTEERIKFLSKLVEVNRIFKIIDN
jgi:hypothetical protein